MLLEYVVVHVTLDENDTISFKMGRVDENVSKSRLRLWISPISLITIGSIAAGMNGMCHAVLMCNVL